MALANLHRQPKLERTSCNVIDLSSDDEEPSPGRVEKEQAKRGAHFELKDKEGAGGSSDEDWENESVLNDLLENAPEMELVSGPNCCGPEEAVSYRKMLHEIGAERFILETVTSGNVTVKKLCTAFGINITPFADAPDEHLYPVLGKLINEELGRRQKLPQFNTIDDAAALLNKSQNIIVITGAGISTSLGIPDFRSKTTGFYSKLLAMGYEDPEEVFDIRNFDDNPKTFYELAGEIVPDLKKWTPTHEFIHLLEQKGKLLTNYTQNIDNLESNAGISSAKLIQCHGSWATATCRKCNHKVPGVEIFADVKAKQVAKCKTCIQRIKDERPGLKRKRSSNDGKRRKKGMDDDDDDDGRYDIPEPGVMKPDITFFGEALPNQFFERITQHDLNKVDLVLVIGTSMKVAPVSEIPRIMPPLVPHIYVSLDPVRHINFDITLLGQCDAIVSELCRRTGWVLKHDMIPDDEANVVEPCEGYDGRYKVFPKPKIPD
ncbi:MAG: NAD-dependent histone deacetylase sir2 [Bathelium mastoideum]|nr:MAG: NAD-dependent histone deacetylase sir2 [Bathelium mastoideum]KAI9686013.1 MAG: NAD-dependent histone deacetylase sir2 [Bathelium mastoideum]